MSDSEKPKSWKERKQSIKHKWHVLPLCLEWPCEWILYCLDKCAVFCVLSRVPRLFAFVSVIYGAIIYITETDIRQMLAENQQKTKQYQAWQVINTAQGKPGNLGRSIALQDLYRDGISFGSIDLSKAYLPNLNLQNANLTGANLSETNLDGADLSGANLDMADLSGASLRRAKLTGAYLQEAKFINADLKDANLTGAHLFKADIVGADFSGANLTDANLCEADFIETNLLDADLTGANLQNSILTDIQQWQKIKSVKSANIDGVRNPPDGFKEWATEHDAVSIEDHDEWINLRREK